MAGTLGIFLLLLKKNFLVRKKRWVQSLVAQILIPIALFLIGQTVRLMTDNSAKFINTTTYYEIESKQELLGMIHRDTTVRFTPENSATIDLMHYTRTCLQLPESNVNGALTEETMIKDLTKDQVANKDHVDALGVVFETVVNNSIPNNFKYKIRMGSDLKRDLYDPEENGNLADHILMGSPIVPLQLCLDEAFINWVASTSTSKVKKYKPEISIQKMPYPPYTRVDRGTAIGGDTFAEIIRFIFLIILCIEISFPANEKYIGINILMSVNGVSTKMNLFSWLTSGAIFSTCYLAPIVLIMKHFMPPQVVPFLTYGNPFIVWLVLFIHCWHVLAFGYHLSSYFWKPSHGIFATFMFLVILNNIARFATGLAFRHFLLYVGVICPNILLKRMFEEITVYESKLIGTKWSNMFVTGTLDAPGEGSIGVMLIFSIIGILFNFYMAVYIYAVRPGKYGVSQNPLFFFQKHHKVEDDENKIDFEKTKIIKREFENVPEGGLEPGIRLRGLKKVYSTSWFRQSMVYALKGVSMDFYKGQITALLGHNGAGKTTMMSILSGLTSLSEGIVFIDGKNIKRDPDAIKNNIGLCPQENMVFPDLTVYQQLSFFGTLKAGKKSKQELEEEIEILLDKVNLEEKRNFIPKQLSGGQKRRLCLAMAVIGDASVLILDEPTSGMDAESKREVWDIVLKMRGEKTIIISTHDMEEADILGDRIAIMHTGRLKSYGTSMFLKKLYGDGQVEVTLSVKPWCDSSKVIQEIEIPSELLNQDEGKMVFAIPMTESLPETLDKLESLKQKLGITGMSVSIITLEQVFLRVTREDTDDVDSNDPIRSTHKVTGFSYFTQCFKAFMIKKIIFMRKNPWTCWLSLLMPCLSCTMMLMAYGEKGPRDSPTPLTLDAYGYPRAFVKSSNPYLAHMYATGIREFGGKTDIIETDSKLTVSDALLQASFRDIGIYRNRYITSTEFNRTGDIMKANGFYSGTAYLGIPIALNAISNAIVKAMTDDESYRIQVSAQQLPSSWAIAKTDGVDGPMITLAIIVFLAPAIGLYVTQPLLEARSGVKQLQNMTGASKIAYWGSMFLFDMSQYIISSLLLLATFILVDISLGTHFYRGTEIFVFLLLMVLFGMSMLPFVYMASFLKKTLNATINVLSVAPLILGFVEMILVAVTFAWDNNVFKMFRKVQSRLFQLFPYLSFTYGHVSFFGVVSRNARCRRMSSELIEVACISIDECCEAECSNGDCKNPFPYFVDSPFEEVPSLSTSMYYMAGSFFLFFAIVFVIELQFVERLTMKMRRRKSWKANTMGIDELVMKEKAVVADEINKKINGIFEDDNENVFLVHNVRKNYGALEVVKGISFRVKEGECFGLLGVNGAGKSTTFRMLTGEELPNGGQMWLKDFDIENSRIKYLEEMGYCPQQDAIIETLNSWDHLYLFARLRGVPWDQVHDVVKKWIGKLNLTACAAQPSGTYSGGNKRRLNIAIALIGNPSLVLMDEPTTGVDPAARRSLWNTLKICQDSGQSIILTSHSMEECEVLCNRLVIMVKGQLVCVGASQELKQRFGAGYNIHVKLSPNRNYSDVEHIKRRIETHLECKLTDENSGFLGYHVIDPQATWTIMYTMLNELKSDYSCIEDFAVLSSTLEQLFIQFARAPDDALQNNGNVPKKWWQKSTRGAPEITTMNETLRIFLTVLKKAFQVRKKCWIRTIIVQILLPIGFFLIAQTVRLLSDNSAKEINYTTYYEIQSRQNILFNSFGLNVLRFTPNTSAAMNLITNTKQCLGNKQLILHGATDEDTMVKDLTWDKIGNSTATSLGIVFETTIDDSIPTNFKYKFRTDFGLQDNLYDVEENGNMANYFMSPAVPVQLCLDEAYVNWTSQKMSSAPVAPIANISIQQMPYPPYTKVDRGTAVGGKIFAEMIKFLFLIILCVEIVYPANEKYVGINILMSVNGVTAKLNLFSWFTSAAVLSTFYLTPIVLIMRHFMPPDVIPFLTFGSPLIVWIALFLNFCHMLSFGYHLSSYFWKPSNGIFATFTFLAILNNIANFATSAAARHVFLYIGFICPSTILQRMFDEITVYESQLVGINWSNMFLLGSVDAPAEGSLGVMLIFSIIGILFNFYMTLYINTMWPGKYGVSRNPFSCRRNESKIHHDEDQIDFEKTNSSGKEFENIPEGTFEPGIRIRGLKKVYTKGLFKSSEVHALKGVSMDFYKKQITVLLGHNGAGKTTMMSILSGLTDLTGGVILIDGKNIQRDPSSIKNNIGLCPQANMVFSELTVYQHLFFFGTLKARNKTKDELNLAIDILLDKVNLTEKRNFIPKQLSGGQKRRLCLAMAVIGDGNVLILDEPTSGMDAESKREVWDIVLKMRGEKTILISTHDMEEADILGDRVAIMHTGRLKSYGTSMFLKKFYGDGQVEVTLSVEPWCEPSKIIREIEIPAELLNHDEGKIVLAIPQVKRLPEALDHLESSRKDLGITGMSVSIITLEQVFLRVTRNDDDVVETRERIDYPERTTGLDYFCQCFFAFTLKKFTTTRKKIFRFWLSLLLPCLACTVMLTAFGNKLTQGIPITLTLASYDSPLAFIKSIDDDFGRMYAKSVSQMGGSANIIESNSTMSVTNALLGVAHDDIGIYRNRYIVSAEVNQTQLGVNVNGFYSGTAYLGIPLTLNTLSNAMLKTVTKDHSHSIEASIQQIPSSWAIQQREIADGWMITVAIIVYIAPAIGLHVAQPLNEALSGIKQLQNMTGASKLAYWICMFVFDYIQYIISTLVLLGSLILVDQSLDMKFYGETEILVFMELMILFGLSMLPFIYCISFLKKSLNSTMIFQGLAPSILGLMEMILTMVEVSWKNEIFKDFRMVQSKIFQLFPFVSFMYGHATYFTVVSQNARCRRMADEFIAVSCIIKDPCCDRQCTNGDCKNPFSYFDRQPPNSAPNLSTSMIYLAGSCVLFSLLIFIMEQQLLQRVVRKIAGNKVHKTDTVMDELVMREKTIVADEVRKKINNIPNDENENVFLAHDLRKKYGKLEVVKGISFRVREGECFGLLGVNGAGKSTTFRMLTGEERSDGGQMWLKKFNIDDNRLEYVREMGYCPQQDAIIGSLNTWDHLYLFAKLRGIPPSQVHDVVEKWIRKLNLTACASQPSSTYSGGNKRRLNIAIALIGNPSLVLMDEPTTGVDPAARRSLWNTLKACQDSGQSFILTSHSMEECEVLCNRLVIMVKGQLVCVGASEQLKQRFGAGYNIHVKLIPSRNYADVESIKKKIESNLTCTLTDENSGFLNFHVTDAKATWTLMYSLLNELKNNYSCIEDFAVLSSTLEQLFIQFARAPDNGQVNNGYVREEQQQRNNGGAPVNSTMAETMRIFFILLKKNFHVRTKCWFRTIVVQLIIPIGLFLMGQTVGLFTTRPAQYENTTTHYPVQSKQYILLPAYGLAVLRFTPETNATTNLVKYTRECLWQQKLNVSGAVDEKTMVKSLTKDQVGDYFGRSVGIVFETVGGEGDPAPAHFKYKIRTNRKVEEILYDPEENGDMANMLGRSVIVPLQLCLDEAYINWVSSNFSELRRNKADITIQQMPYPPYMRVIPGAEITGQIFSAIIQFIFLIILCIEIAYPASEKHIGINILMSVNGVTSKMNLFSWFTSAALFSILYLVPFVIIMEHFAPRYMVSFLTHGNPFITWMMLFFNFCHVLSFGYHLSSYFWKPSKAILATFMLLVILNNVTAFTTVTSTRRFLLYIGLICPSILFQRMFEEIIMRERQLIGIHWSNMFSIGSENAPAEGSVGVMLIFTLIGIVLNFYLAVFIHRVLPGKYGVSKNPFACFRKKDDFSYNGNTIDFEETNNVGKEFEKNSQGTSEPGIRIRGLKKIYTKGLFKTSKVEALKGVSMDFYKGQITALLGHNGAGKTTMMSILSGLTDLTEGVILIDGKNIQRDPSGIKNNIGLCPQENMVFPELTVFQHLLFFGTLKARDKSKCALESDIEILLNKVNLTDKRNVIPKQLSGGQKRRLCLAMAIIGDGNVVILDEPTSGMDAQSKREVWDIVLKMRGEKTIIISTHDMEEANILGDRIAIMHTGRLKSYGTSMFLKKLYGNGQVEVTLSVEPWCDLFRVIQEIKVSAEILNQGEGKVVLAIPQVESLPEALDHLESSQKDLGITGMSVSMITLEQVFLRVSRDDVDAVELRDQYECWTKVVGLKYFLQCFSAFLRKKFTSAQKNLWTFWLSLLLPCLASTAMLAVIGATPGHDTPVALSLSSYNSPAAFVKSSDTDLGLTYTNTINQFGGKVETIPENSTTTVTDALLKVAYHDVNVYKNRYIVSAEFKQNGSKMTANGFYSGTAYRGIPVTLNVLSNVFLKALTKNESYRIETSAQQIPLPWAIVQREESDGWIITMAIMICITPAIALYVTQPLDEARSGVKQLQLMTGASKFGYWASMFLFDFFQYIISCLLLLSLFIIVDKSLGTKFYGSTEIIIFMELMLLLGLSMLPFVYCMSFLKKSLTAAIIMQLIAPAVLGLTDLVLILTAMTLGSDSFQGFRDAISGILQLFPLLSFLYGQLSFFTVVSKNARCRRMTDEFINVLCTIKDPCCDRQCSGGECKDPFPYFDENSNKLLRSLSPSLVYLLGSFLLFSMIIVVIEQRILQRIIMMFRKNESQKVNTVEMDELVVKEEAVVSDDIRKKIAGIPDDGNENIFLVSDLRKRYGGLHVVRGISFRVKEGECFGLLGVNGAGKSTTFRMLIGEESGNGGQMWLKNFSIENNRAKYLQEMGYCPQQDAIMGALNSWDHLYLFARLRGVPEDQVHNVVDKWIRKLNLTACAEQASSTYSGGNKRRLNIAIALIGNPSLVLMDEPTTGVDPAARRSLWNTLKTCQDSGQSFILTSHSMEECEVLCNRLVIMVKGQLVCVGASQELKQRFGAGYNIHVKLFPSCNYADVETIKRKIHEKLTCKLTDENPGLLNYHVTDSKATWTLMYALLNELKNNYSSIEDFAVLSSTLEQLFIQFARASDDEQRTDDEVSLGLENNSVGAYV
ncbi:uncharacterized protein LOC135162614 [Diachasmimorpha longicaudata]|uniref:uncharacterized protein LOC135162614 n=1 Tax=Diachasmimorpha longicaudata TaxID=58733 RepID=UPI0030B8BB6E